MPRGLGLALWKGEEGKCKGIKGFLQMPPLSRQAFGITGERAGEGGKDDDRGKQAMSPAGDQQFASKWVGLEAKRVGLEALCWGVIRGIIPCPLSAHPYLL